MNNRVVTPSTGKIDRMPNPSIFPGSTSSTWAVSKAGAQLGSITLLTSDDACRADLVNAGDSNMILIGRDGKLWRRDPERDVDYATFTPRGFIPLAAITLPPMLLPFAESTKPSFEFNKNGSLFIYHFRFGRALYWHDRDQSIHRVEVVSGSSKYQIERQSLTRDAEHIASVFNLRT